MSKVTITTTIVMTFESKMPKKLLQWWLKNRGNLLSGDIDKYTEAQIEAFMNETGHAFPDFDMSRGASDILLTELAEAQPSNIANINEVNTIVSVEGIGVVDNERWILSPEEKQNLQDDALKHEYEKYGEKHELKIPTTRHTTVCRGCGKTIFKPSKVCFRCAKAERDI